ncbi:MAG: homoserine dehydrogenase [Bacillota bacterium]
MRQLHIAMIGFGAVGKEVARMIFEQGEEIAQRTGVEVRFTAIADSSGAVYVNDQSMLGNLLDWKTPDRSLGQLADAHRAWSLEEFLAQADCLVELGPTNLQTAQPSLDRIRWALALGRHVITGNKGPMALDYGGLTRQAQQSNLKLLFSAAICGGLPVLDTARGFVAEEISGFEGVLGATPNHILSRMESDGLDYQASLNLTRALGIAERDVRLDVEGWDTAAKTVILANALLGAELTMAQVHVRGITEISPLDLTLARRQGGALKLVGWAKKQNGKVFAQVEPKILPLEHPLARVTGAAQAITLESPNVGRVTLSGGASNPHVAASAVMRDLIRLAHDVADPVKKAGPAEDRVEG